MKCFKKSCRSPHVMVCILCGREACERHGDGALCQMCRAGNYRLPLLGMEPVAPWAFHDGACRCASCRAGLAGKTA